MNAPEHDLAVNCAAQLQLLELCRAVAPEVTIVHAGTRQIYGRQHYLPVDEAHPLRPAADTLDWIGFDLEGRGELGHDCLGHRDGQFSLAGRTLHLAAHVMRTLPFQNTDLEGTRTIGQLDPQRPGFGLLTDSGDSPFPLGTTH